jgi:GNAT superfamily N-acetyltransferase
VFALLFGGAVPEDRATRFFAIMARLQMRHGMVYRTEGDEAAAIWTPPGHWRLPAREIVRNLVGFGRAFGLRIIPNLEILGRLEKAHPREEPHYYLEFVGTTPAEQGKGRATRLIQPVLDRCDEEGMGAYLESSKESNIAYYHRFGFEVREVITHKAGPQQWLMWRAPRPPV